MPHAPDPWQTVEHVDTPSTTITTPAATTHTDPSATTHTPNERYQLGPEIARGGMGVVYRAVDAVFGRAVAIKVLLNTGAGSSESARRFHDEACITGQLQHPAIPPVHDLGVLPDGRPFLAMKLIQGQTLHDLLQQRSNIAHECGRFIAIFEQICQAVGYAHAHGVIHRDLKPQNIMVGSFGEVQVMDWGLAKSLTAPVRPPTHNDDPDGPVDQSTIDEERTHAGQAMGTPAYMPPEQARGEIALVDQRADVFALGGVLCAILTGHAPYRGTTIGEVLRRASIGQLDEAFARLDQCDADAEWVELCRRCLRIQPEDRPTNAGEVADAVATFRIEVEQRLRQAEQERAAAEAKASEQRKKRRVQLALAASIGCLLLGSMVVAWWQVQQRNSRQRENEQRTIRHRDALAAALDQGEQALRQNEYERATLAMTEVAKRQAESPIDELTARIDQARADHAMLGELERINDFRWIPLDNQVPDRHLVAAEWEKAFTTYGLTRTTSLSDATTRYRASLIQEPLLAALDHWLAYVPMPEIAAILNAIDPDPFRDTVRAAWVANDLSHWVTLAQTKEALTQPPRFVVPLTSRGVVPKVRQRELLERSIAGRRNELTVLISLGMTYPINQKEWTRERLRWYQAAVAAYPHHAAAQNNLGLALRDHGDLVASIAALKEAIRLSPTNAIAYNNLGNALRDHGELDDAIQAYRASIKYAPNDANVHTNLSIALRDKKDWAEALAVVQEAIRLNPKAANAYLNWGMIRYDQGDMAGSIQAIREAIRVGPATAQMHHRLGLSLRQQKAWPEALVAFQGAIRLDPKASLSHYYLGLTLMALGKSTDAIAAYQEAIRHDPAYVAAHNDLGNAYRSQGKHDLALAAYREAIRLNPNFDHAHYNMGLILFDLKQWPQSKLAFQEAIRANPKYALAYNGLGYLLIRLNDYASAVTTLNEAIRLDPSIAHAHMNLALAFAHQGQVARSLAASKEALRLAPDVADIHNRAAWLFATGPANLRDGKRAVEWALKACELTQWKNADYIDTLAATYAEAGQFEQAIEMQKKALSFAEHERQQSPQARQSLELYQQKKPYRDPTFQPKP